MRVARLPERARGGQTSDARSLCVPSKLISSSSQRIPLCFWPILLRFYSPSGPEGLFEPEELSRALRALLEQKRDEPRFARKRTEFSD